MNNRRFALLVSIMMALLLGALVLTMAFTSPVRAQTEDENVSIEKGPDQMIRYGSTANFTIAVTNTSGTTLTLVTVSDPLAPDCSRVVGQMLAGTHTSYDCSLGSVSSDFTNIITVTANMTSGQAIASDIALVDVISPSIAITKTPDAQVVVQGDPVTFTIAFTNTGDVRLTDVTVEDPLVSDCDFGPVDLDPTASTSYECSLDSASGNFTNQATATGTPPVGSDVSDSDTASVDVIAPAVAVDKSPYQQMARSGDTVTWTIAVTNTGDVALVDVTVDDFYASDCDRSIGGLDSTDSYSYTCTLGPVSTDLTAFVTVTGTSSLLGVPVSDTDVAYIDLIAPEIAIAKTPDVQYVDSGATASFTLAFTNTGDAALTNVIVSDPFAPDCDYGPVDLDPDQEVSYSCDVTTVDDGFINSATVSGTTPLGETVTDADAAEVLLTEAQSCSVDMEAYWKLDETGGSTYDDYYDGHDGICAGQCPTPVTGGQIGGGQFFNGSETGIDVSQVAGDESFNWGDADSFSLAFWMRANHPDACSGYNQVILGRDDAGSDLHWWVGCWSTGEAALVLIDAEGNRSQEFLHGTTDLSADTDWHHIVAVRDASAQVVRLYVDGVQEDTSTADTYQDFASLTSALNIGWLNLNSGYHFAGTLDEMAVYGKALTSFEIEQYYHEGLLEQRGYCEDSAFAPTIYSDPETEAAVQRPYTYDTDAIGSPVPTYTLVVSPAGMTIDPVTGLISWKPVVAQQGSHSVQVQTANTQGADAQSFTVEVAEGPLCPANMLSYWKLDETSGTTFADFYNGNEGACSGGECPSPIDAQVDGGQAFAGSDEIDVPADATFDWGATDSFAVEFWMQTDATSTCSGNQVVVGRDDAATSLHWWVGCQDGGTAAFYLIDKSGGTVASVTSTIDLTDGFWHHVVAMRDADVNQLYMYVDSQQEDTESATFADGFDSATAAVNIGWLNLNGGYHFEGVVDEVALYGRALDTTEIQDHYDRGVEGYGYCVEPGIAVAKTADPTVIYAEETVTYTYVVTNSGDDPLSNLSLVDDQCSPVTFVDGDANANDVLDLAETWSYSCTAVLAEDTANIATVEADHSVGGTVSDTATASVNVINPDIVVVKQANPTTIYPGGSVTYLYAVTNPGDDPLSSVSVGDDHCSPVTFVSGDDDLDDELDPPESWIFNCTTTLADDTTNTAIVVGTDSLGHMVGDSDTAAVDVIHPEIALDKAAHASVVYAGDTVTYTYQATNPGDDPLSEVSVSDDRCNPVAFIAGDDNGDDQLGLDETWTYRCATNLLADTINTAVITAADSLNGPVTDTDTVFVNVINPDIVLAKRASAAMIHAADMVTYTYTVTNPKDDPLSNVSLSDDKCSPVTFGGGDVDGDDRLDSDEVWTFTCVMSLTQDTTNTATVTGTNSLGDAVSDMDQAVVTVIDPALAIDKVASDQVIEAGETVTYTYTVTNPGNDPLSGVSVSDDKCSPVSFVDGDDDADEALDPGEAWTYECAMALSMPTTNVALVSALDSLGETLSRTATVSVVVVSEDFYLVYLPVVMDSE